MAAAGHNTSCCADNHMSELGMGKTRESMGSDMEIVTVLKAIMKKKKKKKSYCQFKGLPACTAVLAAPSPEAIKQESDLDDDDESEPEEEDTEDRMHKEDIIDDSLRAPVDEDYKMALSSFLRNPYTPLTFPESSPPAILVT
ncbi:hypothetical protein CY34DRAFT_16275 [Suillus luteus UH-Slu-Lm8-n1]|uniref:Uncharacterized protein n=1 Tax=Suillus luteus UH-Slu-Lm8-n1 TaxID=930992 RepID=A0A0D0AXK3_9AGAM|nr:hypothetical protein CY34DRAFT_16275 [Suillus luteus UH-Slu-Lm8-n1]